VIYLDTGCLVKLYFPEPDSARVAALVAGQALVYSGLHELEVTNALELKVFRKEAVLKQAQATRDLIATDVRAGILHAPTLAWSDIWLAASELARKHSRTLGCRSLDILHCAVAAQLDVAGFVTTDRRQRRLAAKLGMRCPEVR